MKKGKWSAVFKPTTSWSKVECSSALQPPPELKDSRPVDYALHLSLDDQVVVWEEGEDGLDVGGCALVAVDDQLVVVSGLQHHVQDCLVKLVLDQKVGAEKGSLKTIERIIFEDQICFG